MAPRLTVGPKPCCLAFGGFWSFSLSVTWDSRVPLPRVMQCLAQGLVLSNCSVNGFFGSNLWLNTGDRISVQRRRLTLVMESVVSDKSLRCIGIRMGKAGSCPAPLEPGIVVWVEVDPPKKKPHTPMFKCTHRTLPQASRVTYRLLSLLLSSSFLKSTPRQE